MPLRPKLGQVKKVFLTGGMTPDGTGTCAPNIDPTRLLIDAVFFGRLDHGSQIFRGGIVNLSAARQNVSATLPADLNEIPAMLFHFSRRSRTHQRGRHIARDTVPVSQNLLGSGHIRAVKPPDDGAFRQIFHGFQTLVIAALGEQQRHATFLYQTQYDFFQAGPVKRLKLFLGHEGIVALVQSHEDNWYPRGIRSGHSSLNDPGRYDFHRFLQLGWLAVHIHHDSPGPAQRIAKQIERGMSESAVERRVSCGLGFLRDFRYSLTKFREFLACVNNCLKRFLNLREHASSQENRRHPKCTPEGEQLLKRLKGSQCARQIDPHEEIGWILEQGVVFVGLHVLAFYKLRHRGVFVEAMAGPHRHSRLRNLMKPPGSDTHTRNDARIPVEVIEELPPCALHFLVVIHGRAHRDSSVGSRKLAGGKKTRDAVRLLHADRSNDSRQTRVVALFCGGTGKADSRSGKPSLEPLLPLSFPWPLGWRLGRNNCRG